MVEDVKNIHRGKKKKREKMRETAWKNSKTAKNSMEAAWREEDKEKETDEKREIGKEEAEET